MKKEKQIFESLLEGSGVSINGNNPEDLQVHNENFYRRVLSQGSLGLGESYMDGWWDCQSLDDFFYLILRYRIDEKVKEDWILIVHALISKIFNLQSHSRAFIVGEKHYDTGNDLFVSMLGRTMGYSCCYWSSNPKALNLDEAQEAKFDLICRKLGLKSGMRILDIGCGWGTFIKYATENYGVKAVGLTVSKEQEHFARELCYGLPVEIRLKDYRDVNEKFDCIVSVGMMEHVGYKNYRTYMEVANKNLKEGGLFLLHTIGSLKSITATESWIGKYIFPNGQLPSIKQIGESIEGLFIMEDWHNFGPDYDKTLMAWYENFKKSWPELKEKYSERFYRMWEYYLLSCAGSFRARNNQLWQIVLSKNGVSGGYNTIR